jgi:hypothetical protein
MYGQDPDLIRTVLKNLNLSWPQILFVATHGTPTKALTAWRAQAEEEHEARQEEYEVKSRQQGWHKQPRRPFEVTGQPVRFSKAQLVKFYRAYERIIWDAAYDFISGTEKEAGSRFEALGKCLGHREDIESLADVASAAASWAIGEACQTVFSDYESNAEHEEGTPEDYAQFRDIWAPSVEHEDVHTDTSFEESSAERIISAEVLKDMAEEVDRSIMKRLKPGR